MARYIAQGGKWVLVDKDGFPNHNYGLNGPVYCPDGGYYDPVLNRRFESKQEKRDYMRANKLQMHSGGKKQTEGNPGKTYYFFPGLSRKDKEGGNG